MRERGENPWFFSDRTRFRQDLPKNAGDRGQFGLLFAVSLEPWLVFGNFGGSETGKRTKGSLETSKRDTSGTTGVRWDGDRSQQRIESSCCSIAEERLERVLGRDSSRNIEATAAVGSRRDGSRQRFGAGSKEI